VTEDVEVIPATPDSRPGLSNLADLVAGHAAERPEVIAVVQPGPARRTLTWAELNDQVDAVAAGLASRGLVAGQRVALLGANSIEWVIAYFAALRAGFVVVPVNPQSTAAELQRTLADCGARVLLTDRAEDRVDAGDDPATVPDVEVLELSPTGLAALAGAAASQVGSPQDREALAVLLYTAGTSGWPKAAMLSHRALLAHLAHIDEVGIITAESHLLAVLPLFHVFGLNAVLGSWAMAGGRLVLMDGLAADVFPVVSAEQITNLPVAPAIIHRLLTDERLETGLAGVRTVLSGAAPLPPDLRDDFTRRTGRRIEQGYGLTEAAPGVSATFGGPLLGLGHVGRALPGVEIRIADGSDPSEPGEIWVRGDNLFSGYWPNGDGGPGPDGWFSTSDIGYLSDSELFLVDRSRDLVIVNGFNVYPAEVEQVIADLPGVTEVAVVGRPDARTGEQVVAFVVGSVSVDEVEAHCQTQLAKFKRPSDIRVVSELPRGAAGKILKGALRQSLGAQEQAP
jgi:long-chain acyl-CoA synthetase